MIDQTLAEPREIVTMEPDDGGSIVTLACGHVIWCALEPVYSAGRLYCSICVHEMLEQIKHGQKTK